MISRLLTAVMLTGASYMDIKKRKISNSWIIVWIIIGIFVRGTDFIIPPLITVLILSGFFVLRMLGAGDIKLIALTVGFLGASDSMEVIFISLLIAAAYGFYKLRKNGSLKARFVYFGNYIRDIYRNGKIPAYYDEERDGKEAAMPMSPWLLAGFIIWRVLMLCRI